MSFSNKIKKAGFWQAFEIVTLVIAQFFYIGIMTRNLSKEDFGLMAIANSFIAFGAIFSEGGMGAALIQRKYIDQNYKNAALQGGIILGLLIFIIFYLAAPHIADFFKQPSLKEIIREVGLNIIFISGSSISLALLHRDFKFKQSSIVTATATIIAYACGIIAAISGLGVWSLIMATLIMTALSTLGYLYFSPIKIRIKIYRKELKELLSFGLGIILQKITNFFANNGPNLVLGKIFLTGTLGIFERSNKIKTLPSLYLGNLIEKVLFPAVSQIQNETKKIVYVLENGLGIANSILMPVTIYLVLYTKEIVLIILGPDWMEAVAPLQIMFIVLPFSISIRVLDVILRSTGNIYNNLRRKFVVVIFLLASISIGAIKYGLTGAAMAVTLSYVLNFILTLFLVKRVFEVKLENLFFHPFKVGSILSIGVAILTIPFRYLIASFSLNPILSFVLFSIFILALVTIISLKMPAILGKYIKLLISNLQQKDSKWV